MKKILIISLSVIAIYYLLSELDYINQYLNYTNLPVKTNNDIYDKNIPDSTPLNRLRFLSTHNSYHKKPGFLKSFLIKLFEPDEVNALQYSHPPLYNQFDNGIRGIELDVRYVNGSFVTMHVPIVDNNSNSPDVMLAMKEIKRWSDNHPVHIPIVVLIELSREWNKYYPAQKKWTEELLLKFDKETYNILQNKLITPNDIKYGYPELKDVRGKILIVFMADSDIIGIFGKKYKKLHKATHIMTDNKFPEKSSVRFVKRDNPFASDIDSLVNAGFIVRTRIDADLKTGIKRKIKALNSKAQIISTDFPENVNIYNNSKYHE
ncbi:MAG: hypothetical protein GXO47_12480 [Chlorobi bacterium]|nr:hypothetical protein [Chlorobiota bacterium]